MIIDTFTGGLFDTNCFFIENGDHSILFDAPQDAAAWLRRKGKKVGLLLLTHGHVDHVMDAAEIQREHGCPIGCHRDTIPMITDREFFRRFGFGLEVEPVSMPEILLEETAAMNLGGIDFTVLLVPGHCPGSLCFFSRNDRLLIGGDVLFAGGVGRWDLPGGDRDLLFSGIKSKLFPLGDDVRVLPGHGPATTIGTERRSNPFLAA